MPVSAISSEEGWDRFARVKPHQERVSDDGLEDEIEDRTAKLEDIARWIRAVVSKPVAEKREQIHGYEDRPDWCSASSPTFCSRGLTDAGNGIDERSQKVGEGDMIRSSRTLVIRQDQEIRRSVHQPSSHHRDDDVQVEQEQNNIEPSDQGPTRQRRFQSQSKQVSIERTGYPV